MTTFARLAWALPLVLGIGVAAMLLLRRFMLPTFRMEGHERRMRMRESLPVSGKTSVHLIEVDGQEYLVIESAQQAALQALPRVSTSQ